MSDPVPAIMEEALPSVVGESWAAGTRGSRQRSGTAPLPFAVWRGATETFDKSAGGGVERTPYAAVVDVWDRPGRYAETRSTAYSIVASLLAQEAVLRVEITDSELTDLPDPPAGVPPDAELVRLFVEIG